MMVPLSTRNSSQRGVLAVFNQVATIMVTGILAALIFPMVILPMIGSSQTLWISVMSVLCIIMLPVMLLEYYFTKERVTEELGKVGTVKIPYKMQIKAVLHIHYVFWEKEPKVKNQRAAGYIYRKKGKIPLNVIDKMTERLNAYTIDDDLAKKRQKVVEELTQTSNEYDFAHINDLVRKWLKELADELPHDKPLWYGNNEMKPYHAKIDLIAEWLIDMDERTSEADHAFRQELREKEQKLKGIMGNYYKDRLEKEKWYMENIPNFTDVQGIRTIHTIEKLEWDYRRRLGNIVLKKVREIQKETYKRNPRRKYKTNDKYLKCRLAISTRRVRGIMDGLFSAVAELFSPKTENYRNRLKEIEEEMQEEYAKE